MDAIEYAVGLRELRREDAMDDRYAWIPERARAGEPVALDVSRRDMPAIIDYLTSIDGRGLLLQSDYEHGILWVSMTKWEQQT